MAVVVECRVVVTVPTNQPTNRSIDAWCMIV
jgi:hypothetical protein